MATKKDRLGDGKINTGIEMIEDQEEKLWEQNPMEALRYEKIDKKETELDGKICLVDDYSSNFLVFNMVTILRRVTTSKS